MDSIKWIKYTPFRLKVLILCRWMGKKKTRGLCDKMRTQISVSMSLFLVLMYPVFRNFHAMLFFQLNSYILALITKSATL